MATCSCHHHHSISCSLATAMAVASGSSASGAALASGDLALACAAPTRAPLEAPGCHRPRTHIVSTALLTGPLRSQPHHLRRSCLVKQLNHRTRTFLRHPHKVQQLSFAMSPQWHSRMLQLHQSDANSTQNLYPVGAVFVSFIKGK